jgi:hypothetical protein
MAWQGEDVLLLMLVRELSAVLTARGVQEGCRDDVTSPHFVRVVWS